MKNTLIEDELLPKEQMDDYLTYANGKGIKTIDAIRCAVKFAELLQANSGNAVDERAAFEAWAKKQGYDLMRWEEYPDMYLRRDTQDAWWGYQSASLANKPDAQYRKLMAAFHANMVHAYPNKTHEEISEDINQAITKG